jgi:hypothetical protein
VPITHRVDHERRLVTAWPHGVMTDDDVSAYPRSVRSRADVAGYDELIDMRDVAQIALPSGHRARELAQTSAAMDDRARPSKLAIIATQEVAFGLGRMYEAYRSLDARSTKQVAVFRDAAEALYFLGLDRMPERPSNHSTD